jgi:hypothetical protein
VASSKAAAELSGYILRISRAARAAAVGSSSSNAEADINFKLASASAIVATMMRLRRICQTGAPAM